MDKYGQCTCIIQNNNGIAMGGQLCLEGLVLLNLGLQVRRIFVTLIAGSLIKQIMISTIYIHFTSHTFMSYIFALLYSKTVLYLINSYYLSIYLSVSTCSFSLIHDSNSSASLLKYWYLLLSSSFSLRRRAAALNSWNLNKNTII